MNTLKFLILSLFLFPMSVFAESLKTHYLAIEQKWVQSQDRFEVIKSYDKYVSKDPIASLSEDDLNAFKALIADGDVTSMNLRCQGQLEISASQILKGDDYGGFSPVCERGVQHVFGNVLRPRVLTMQYANGMIRQVTIGLKKSASGFCTALENQQGDFLVAVNEGFYNMTSESQSAFNARQTLNSSRLFAASRNQRLGMALYTCCQPVDNGESNCLRKIRKALVGTAAERALLTD
ncbi:MAG: hypothetical protein ACM3MG_12125 [Bacillota bacterium]